MDGKVKNQAEKESIHSVYESADSYVCTVYPELPKELKEMELKAFDDGFEDGKNWSDVLNFVILFHVMHKLYGWGWKRYMRTIKNINNYINDINSEKTSLSEMVDELEKKHHIQICDDYKELIERYGA